MEEDLKQQGSQAPMGQPPDALEGVTLKEGDINPPKQETISTEILKSPNYGRFFRNRYFEVRLGGSGGNEVVDPGKVDMAAVEQDALGDYNIWLKEQASKERMQQEDNRRAQLQEQFFKSLLFGKDRGGSRLERMAMSKPYANQYFGDIAGRDMRDDPISLLESYGTEANSGPYDKELGAPPLDEVESFADRFSQIREELEKDTPDLKRVDTLLAEFLYARLEHFVDTIDQRSEMVRRLDSTGENLGASRG